jgi:hypothetical protein
MYNEMLNKVVIVRLKEVSQSGRDSFSAKMLEYRNVKLKFENKTGSIWIVDEDRIDSVITLKNKR